MAAVFAVSGAGAGCSSGGAQGSPDPNSVLQSLHGDDSTRVTVAPDADEVAIGLYNVEGGSEIDLPMIADAQEAVVAYANDYLGGWAGRRIVTVRCGVDDTPESAVVCGRKFVDAGVVAVVSGQAAHTEVLFPLLEERSIPYLGAALGSTAELGNESGFFLSAGYLGTVGAWIEVLKDRGLTSVTLLLPTSDGVDSLAPLTQALLERNGLVVELVRLGDEIDEVDGAVEEVASIDSDAVVIVADTPRCRAVLAGLAGSTYGGTVLGLTPCLDSTVIDDLPAEVTDGLVTVSSFDATTVGDEAALYRAVLDKYGAVPESVFTEAGYATMLGLLRLIDATDVAGNRPTAESVTASLRLASPVSAPLGRDDGELDCRASRFGVPLVRSTVCSSRWYVSVVTDGEVVVQSTPVDANVAWVEAFG